MTLQHREAIEPRHHHVEKDEVDAAVGLGQALERFHSVAGLDDPVAQLGQAATEHVAVRLVIVDHEHGLQPAGHRRGRAPGPMSQP